MPDPFVEYLDAVAAKLATGDATEHTYRGDLERLLERLATDEGRPTRALNEPKRIACGAPDYVLRRGGVTVGYIEAKDVGKDLGRVEGDEQLTRYRASLSNLVLTDYLEFRRYVDGEPRGAARLAVVAGGRLQPVPGGVEAVRDLLKEVLAQAPEPVRTAGALADRMARLTRMIHDVALRAVQRGAASDTLRDLRGVLAQTLVPEVATDDEQFVDMYAQTLAYGLFAARVNHTGPGDTFTRHAAAAAIPKTNPLLRKLFDPLTGPSLDDEPHAGFVTDLVALLARADLRSVLEDFGRQKKSEDPVVHFYESFLKAYDPQLRVDRGVFYTPAPVVQYIVRSVDALLKRDFALPGGLQDTAVSGYMPPGATRPLPKVLLLDPACGTGTFLYHVVDFLRQRFVDRGQGGLWKGFVGEELLPRLHGFELLMAPYAVAHLKLGMQLAAQDLPPLMREQFAYEWDTDERLKVFLTNTLEEAEREVPTVFGPYRALTEEAEAAARIKEDAPVIVVLGNPPYAGHSANKSEWMSGLIEDYKRDFPDLYKPGQAKWLHDDYVKFIRWSQRRIDQTGQGVLAFITNNSFLDNPTFKGMRKRLMESFDALYLLNLHGSIAKKETAPDGSKDVNVFDIQQGVSISLFVKREGASEAPATVHYADLWGARQAKYDWLGANGIETTDWETLAPEHPRYLFVPLDRELLPEYERGWPLPEVFGLNGDPAPGMVTTHDQFAVSFTKPEAIGKVETLLATDTEDEARTHFRLCSTTQWDYDKAKRELANGEWRETLTPLLYRPFDTRWTVNDRNVAVHWRERASRHMQEQNYGLSTTRKIDVKGGWQHIWASDLPIQHHSVSTKEVNYIFPLYLYPDPEATDLFGSARQEREANLAPAFIEALTEAVGLAWVPDGTGDLTETVGPEDVLHYAYAVFHSPAFRERYADFLKIDFPRLPLTSDPELFRELCGLGAELVALHLLRSVPSDREAVLTGGDLTVAAGFPTYAPPGAPIGAKLAGAGTSAAQGRVYLNATTYFDGVSPETWATQVGGYQPLEKWLKDRRGRTLTYADGQHYERTVAALAATHDRMADVDAVIAASGGFPLP